MNDIKQKIGVLNEKLAILQKTRKLNGKRYFNTAPYNF